MLGIRAELVCFLHTVLQLVQRVSSRKVQDCSSSPVMFLFYFYRLSRTPTMLSVAPFPTELAEVLGAARQACKIS